MDNRTLDNLSWGTFIILVGFGWLLGEIYQVDTGSYISFGVGVILIMLNVVRSSYRMRVSNFSLFIGLVALAMGGAGILGYSLPLIPTLAILIGLFIIAQATMRR